ncbi:MAG: hypothetical protein LBI47_01210 [Puniceicoccales bacterium]|jgi:hypothetical protein|nr:hypothetical protein [Puniceicoccales bacterium]
MDRITNNNGLNRFFNGAKQAVSAAGRKIVNAAGRTIKNVTNAPSLEPLMRNAQPLVQAFAQPFDLGAFPELFVTPIGNMFREWSSERVDFIRNHCMKQFEECTGDGVTTIEDSNKVFVARSEFGPDISVKQAQDFGFILPGDIDERVRHNPNLKVKPLFIRCFGVGSGNTKDQILEGAKNILSLPTDRLELANSLILSHIESVQERFKSNQDVLVVPLITGFSQGGMFASAIALKNNFPSITFNGLGLGKGGCDFVGETDWARAQRQQNSHIAMVVDHDFVASPDSAWRNATRIPGCIVGIPSDNPTINKMYEIHFYSEYFDRARQDYLTSHQLDTRDRLVA